MLSFKASTLTAISCLLIIALVLPLLPQPALAQTDPLAEEKLEYIPEEKVEPAPAQAAFRVRELVEKRERDKKFFLNSDGTTTVEIHSSSIHYLDAGVWQEIDNTIVLDESSPEKSLRNKANSMAVRFPRQFTGVNDLLTVGLGDKSLRITPVGAGGSRAESGSDSTVIYREVYPGIDFEYIMASDLVKENIIINKYMGMNSFSFVIKTAQLTPVLKDREVCFRDKNGDVVFIMPAPFMYDQAHVESYDFDVSLKAGLNSSYTLTYSAAEKWLADSARVYPVIIDPIVVTKQSSAYDQTRDAFADSKNPNQTNKYHPYLKSGLGSGSAGKTRSYIMFPTLPVINAADEVMSAELRLYQSWDTSKTVTVNVYQVTSPWDSATLTWNKQPAFNPRVLDFCACKDADYWRTWNVTPAVKDWYHSGQNNGLLIKHANEDDPILDFISSDNPEEKNKYLRPVLVITYRNQSGLEGYLSYTSMALGRSGAAAVNNYNGNLVYTHTDVSLSGNRLPLYISHVYNSDAKATDIGYGRGWRLNYSQTVRSVVIDSVPYVEYTDGDGTIHHFYLQAGKYLLQTPGIYLDLSKNPDSTYTLKDSQDNELKFNSAGNLTQVKDNQGNTMSIGYSNNRISSITDGAGRAAVLTYSGNFLTKITDPSGRVVNYTYSGADLETVKYPEAVTDCPQSQAQGDTEQGTVC